MRRVDLVFVPGEDQTLGVVSDERGADHGLASAAVGRPDMAVGSVLIGRFVGSVGSEAIVVVVISIAGHLRPVAHVRDVGHEREHEDEPGAQTDDPGSPGRGLHDGHDYTAGGA